MRATSTKVYFRICSGVIVVDASGKKRDLRQLMVDGVHGVNGHHAQGPVEEVLEPKNVIVTIQSKFADCFFCHLRRRWSSLDIQI